MSGVEPALVAPLNAAEPDLSRTRTIRLGLVAPRVVPW